MENFIELHQDENSELEVVLHTGNGPLDSDDAMTEIASAIIEASSSVERATKIRVTVAETGERTVRSATIISYMLGIRNRIRRLNATCPLIFSCSERIREKIRETNMDGIL